MNKKILIGLTQGDPGGVGYELILKAFSNAELFDVCIPVVFGSEKLLQIHRKTMNLPGNVHTISRLDEAREGVLNLLDVAHDAAGDSVMFGQTSETADRLAIESLKAAVKATNDGHLDALVLSPISETVPTSGDAPACVSLFPGHRQCDYLRAQLGAYALQMLCNPHVRVVLTGDNTADVTSDVLDRCIRQCYSAASRDFLCSAPRVAVLADKSMEQSEGIIMTETESHIAPVVQSIAESGVRVFGPYDPVKFFESAHYKHFDCVLAVNYEQGVHPFQKQGMDESISLVLTPSCVYSSPYQDASFSIAGKGETSCTAMLHAIYAAVDICRNRAVFDESHRNPLQFNSFHDRRDDRREVRRDFRHDSKPQEADATE